LGQQDIQVILMRQLANGLAVPAFLVGPNGDLLYYNEPAEDILGRRFEETGAMAEAEWSRLFVPTDETGTPLPPSSLPLVIAMNEGRPSHRPFWIRGLDGVHRFIEVTAFPLIRQDGRSAGAVALFWEVGTR
jgi:PAS domain-containing protein